nr:calcium-binding protein [Brevundimonas denitrificans]
MTGDAGANVLDGGAGADRMEGGAGDDIYHVESRNDVVIELAGGGVDTVLSSVSFDARFTHVENITLLGGANANVVGNALSNIIIGNSADSIIIGNGGADYLTGGGGSDIFKYNEVSDSSFADYDRIMDLGADDFIDLRNIDANANVAGNQVFERVGEFTGQAGQLTLTWLPGAGFTLLAADVDGDGVADMRIVLYGNHEAFENILL